MKALNVTKKLTEKEAQAIVAKADVSKSQKIRELFEGGMDVNNIAKKLGIRYNFAYNIIQNHCLVKDIPVEKSERTGKRDEVVALLKQGKSLVDVAKGLKLGYNYVWRIANEEGFTGKDKKQATAATPAAQA